MRGPAAHIGSWSAAIAATAAIAFDFAVLVGRRLAVPWDVVAPLTPSLLLAPAFLSLLVCVHSVVGEEQKICTRLGVAFAGIYVPLASTAYVVEMLVVEPLVMRGQTDRVALLTLTHHGTVLNAVDGLGSGFMSLASLFAALAFEGARLERWIRRLFLATGVLAVPILLTYFVSPDVYLRRGTLGNHRSGLSHPPGYFFPALWALRQWAAAGKGNCSIGQYPESLNRKVLI